MKRLITKKYFQKELPYLAILFGALLIIAYPLFHHDFISGSDTYFHMSTTMKPQSRSVPVILAISFHFLVLAVTRGLLTLYTARWVDI